MECRPLVMLVSHQHHILYKLCYQVTPIIAYSHEQCSRTFIFNQHAPERTKKHQLRRKQIHLFLLIIHGSRPGWAMRSHKMSIKTQEALGKRCHEFKLTRLFEGTIDLTNVLVPSLERAWIRSGWLFPPVGYLPSCLDNVVQYQQNNISILDTILFIKPRSTEPLLTGCFFGDTKEKLSVFLSPVSWGV